MDIHQWDADHEWIDPWPCCIGILDTVEDGM